MKVKDQLKPETSQEEEKTLSYSSQSCSSCICINILVARRIETKVTIKVFKIDTVIWAIQVQTRICKIQLDRTIVVSSVTIVPESWWVSLMKWVLVLANQTVETSYSDRILTVRWVTQFVDLNTEMKSEAGNNKFRCINQHSKRTWVAQVRCINSSIQTILSIRLQRVHIGMEFEITLRLLRSVTLVTRML